MTKRKQKIDHTHKHKRINIASGPGKEYWVFKCVLPNCAHYVPVNLAAGKDTICWSCDKVFEIKLSDLRYQRIVCDDCKGRRVNNPAIRERIEAKRKELEDAKVAQKEVVDILELIQQEMGLGEFMK